MEQIMEMLKSMQYRMDASQAKEDANTAEIKEMNADMKSNQEKILAKIEASRDARLEGEEPEAAQRQFPREDTAMIPVGGPSKRRGDRNLAVGRLQKPKETAREKCGSRKKATVSDRKVSRRATVARRRRDAAREERTKDKDGCRKKLAVVRRGTTRCAKVAQRIKIIIEKNRTRNNMVRGTLKRWTFRRKRQQKQERKKGIGAAT
jgi:hypothetical protein